MEGSLSEAQGQRQASRGTHDWDQGIQPSREGQWTVLIALDDHKWLLPSFHAAFMNEQGSDDPIRTVSFPRMAL